MSQSLTPIFSGGTGRSGTTIIVNLLSRHSQIHTSMPRELRYVTTNLGLLDLNFNRKKPIRNVPRGTSHKIIKHLTAIKVIPPVSVFSKKMATAWWCETGKNGKPRGFIQGMEQAELQIILHDFEREYKEDKQQASRNLFFKMAVAQEMNEGTKFFADSTPVNILNAQYIYQLLPESRFINMVRDGRDVAVSVVKEHWGPNDHVEALHWWKNRMLLGFNALKTVPAEHQITIPLADLIIYKRDQCYKALLDMLKIESEPTIEAYFETNLVPENMRLGEWKEEVSNLKTFEKEYEKVCSELTAAGVPIH